MPPLGPLAATLSAAAARRAVRHVLETGAVRTLCQPIGSLSTGDILGYEALSRPEAPAPLDAPQEFLAAASACNLLEQVDHAWRLAAVARLGRLLAHEQLLFLNCTPTALTSGLLGPASFQSIVRRHGLQPERVVLEITEERAISDFDQMRRIVSAFRTAGFLFAIDDAGAGPSSLQSIVELRPDFIKLDRWLARDIEFDRGRRSMVEAICTFARQVGARVVAEGIETREQLAAFVELGADFGQGYFLGRPEALPCPVGPDARLAIHRANRQRREAPVVTRVGDLVTITPTVNAETPGARLMDHFARNRHLEAVIVLDGSQVEGIVTRGRIFERMSGQFGLPLNGRRPAAELCVPATCVDASVSPRVAARAALERAAPFQQDPLVILDGTALAGIVRVHELLQAVLAEEVAEARHLNPLTGLPGNRRIREHLERLRTDPAGWYVFYADLDRFKLFNDACGFAHGDAAIYELSRILVDAANAGRHDAFVGHVGGDDFILVLHQDDLEPFRAACYRVLSRPRWFDPDGKLPADISLTVSIAGCPLDRLAHLEYAELAAILANAKRLVKHAGGNTFHIFEDLAPSPAGAQSDAEAA
ncbi:bifunctional diguanylate cyclase/phosphodiesterase [Tepidiforma thermophila]|uniref:Diguanylate cyclase (GGDEF)-like protein n=1 Tax=Tepidiforma thermophila (strain KCTC 52669 / CGMCC 1.13589 / G233) TaxID=2761530 RepID=A0A2A9HHD1_TEPT2|nr:bifunctional diguanylate cyclase/phosphodiesterase [Tepidiforma thermophila]PFG75424.1 diguanylate cyclase (GGDEF)-like protein [Tepidiforma thermophila]